MLDYIILIKIDLFDNILIISFYCSSNNIKLLFDIKTKS